MKETARYALDGSLRYAARDGEMSDAQFIEMNAPTGKHSEQVAGLRQAVVQAIVEETDKARAAQEAGTAPEAREAAGGEDEGEVTWEGMEIINLVARSSVELSRVYKLASDLFVKKGILKVDGDVQITRTLLDNLSAHDFESLVGEYLANFILPS